MMRITPFIRRIVRIALPTVAITLFAACLIGCGPKPAAAPPKGKPAPAAKQSSPAVPAEPADSTTNDRPKSVFVATGPGLKDPFFPGSKAFEEKLANTLGIGTKPVAPPIDLVEALQSGLQGIAFGQIALINNIQLEAGKKAVISLGSGTSAQQVSVECLKVDRASVTLRVPGHSEPVTLNLKQKTRFP